MLSLIYDDELACCQFIASVITFRRKGNDAMRIVVWIVGLVMGSKRRKGANTTRVTVEVGNPDDFCADCSAGPRDVGQEKPALRGKPQTRNIIFGGASGCYLDDCPTAVIFSLDGRCNPKKARFISWRTGKVLVAKVVAVEGLHLCLRRGARGPVFRRRHPGPA